MYMGGIPIVSLDSIYLEPDEEDILFLDSTRLDGSKRLVSRRNPNDLESVDKEIKSLSDRLIESRESEIVLADDVVFSGTVLKTITDKFKSNGINVIGVRAAISTDEGYRYFNKILPLGIKCGCLLGKDVIDQICERDFYYGIAQSGISVLEDGEVYKAPYFLPFGNPVERASIPEEAQEFFSRGCQIRSLALWDKIEKLSNREIYNKDLPEAIYNTNRDDRVVKVLSKGVKKYEKATNRCNGISR